MFPSKKSNDNYGIFCKNVYDVLNDDYFNVVKLCVIRGKSFNKFFNIFRYFFLVLRIYLIATFSGEIFDTVYFQYVWLHVKICIPLIKKWKKAGKKIILNFHGEDLLEFVQYSNNSKNLFLVRNADRIIFPSKYFKNLFLKNYSCNKDRLYVSASGGINNHIFYPDEKLQKEKLIVFCSRFAKDKGYDDFINAVCLVKKQRSEINAVLIGYGEEEKIAEEIIKSTCSESFIKILKRISQPDIAKIYRKALLFVFPTRRLSESLGLVALEAMACGLPVIGSNIAALPEYIRSGKNGFLFECGNVKNLSEKIIEFLDLPENKKIEFSKNSLITSIQYDENKVLNELKDNLKKL